MQDRPSDSSPLPSNALPEDDIDQLFAKLQPLVLPANIVQQVLARVRELPVPPRYQSVDSEAAGGERSRAAQDVSNSSL